MPAIITNDLRITNGDYFQNDITRIPMYVYFGGTEEWDDETNPPDTVDSTIGRIDSTKEILGLKRVFSNDVISVLPRRDWQEGFVYDEYTDKANIIDDKNPETNDFYKFYVVTDEFNVYKCISNNDRSPSTIKPTGTTITSFQTPDGYVWKYMYTITTDDAFKYMTPNWIPIYSIYNDNGSQQWQVQESAVHGSIENIKVLAGGGGYLSTNPPTVTITGNGTGATAIAQVNDVSGQVERIIMTNVGEGYTEAEVLISGGNGLGASAEAVMSPIGGHGSDARRELGAVFKMIRVAIESDEGGILPIGIDYRKSGLLLEPRTNQSGVSLFISDTKLYDIGETVTGQTSGASGVIKSINVLKNQIYLEGVTGTFTQGEYVSSQPYNQDEVLIAKQETTLPMTDLVVNGNDYAPMTGRTVYFANREKITRGINQIEEFRFIIQF